MIIPAAGFAIWAWYRNIFPSIIQQIVYAPKQFNDMIRYPQDILNYLHSNFVLYGSDGHPLTWMYELCLPLIAFAGMFTVFLNIKSFGTKHRIIVWFTAACILQWTTLLFIRSVFIQYFLPVSWFLAVFAAYALSRFYVEIGVNRIYRHIASFVGILVLIGGLIVSWKANNTRAMSSYASQKLYQESQWRIIPQTAVVYPGALFRLSTYPAGFGCSLVDFSTYFFERYGSPSVYLARYRIPYIVLDPVSISYLDVQTKEYINTNYQQDPNDPNIWILRT